MENVFLLCNSDIATLTFQFNKRAEPQTANLVKSPLCPYQDMCDLEDCMQLSRKSQKVPVFVNIQYRIRSNKCRPKIKKLGRLDA